MATRLLLSLRLLKNALIIYFFLSLALIWPALNAALGPAYQSQTNRQLHYQLAGFNPFTLGVFVYGAEDRNPDGSRLWAVSRLELNPSLIQSLAYRALALDAIEVEGLVMLPALVESNRYNFSDIIDYRAGLSTAEDPQPQSTSDVLPRIKIGKFALDARQLQFTDITRAKPYSSGLRDIAFVLRDFSTLSEDGDGYSLRAEGLAGGVFEWHGDLSAAGKKTWGDFSIQNMNLMPLWEFAEPRVAFDLHQGQLNLSGRYEVSWQDLLHWQVNQGRLQILDLSLSARNQSNDSTLAFEQFLVELTRIDSQSRSLDIASVVLDDLALTSWHEADKVGLVETFQLAGVNESSPSDSDQTADEAPWQWRLVEQRINNARIVWRTPELDHRQLAIAPLNLTVTNLNSGESPAQLQLALMVDEQARLAATGYWQTPTQALDLNLQLDRLPLSWANPIVDDFLALSISKGELASQHQLVINNGQLVSIETAASINQFETLDSQGRRFSGFNQLHIDQATVNLADQRAELNRLTLDQLTGSLKINQDGTTNLQALLKSQPEAAAAAESSKSENAAWQWSLNELLLSGAEIDFTDETPLSPFSARIQNFSGSMAPITSDANQPIAVDFTGNVDGYAPVTLKGWAKPLLADPAIDLALKFSAMDLGVFNPYSTTFTGWKIEKGLLTVEMDYGLENKRIVGNNRVVLDQLELGERINSKRLVDIPLKFALALLTDENGVADLAVPVSGTTDDPDFSVGSIIWAAVRNSIMKLITAPFNLLASLAGTDEDLGAIAFAPQSSDLDASAHSKLHSLKTALDQRPSLRIGIVGDVSQAEIRELTQASLNQALTAQGASAGDIQEQNKTWRKAALALLEERALAVPESEDPVLLQQQLLASQPKPTQALDQLIQARALNTKQYFLNTLALNPDRVFVHSISADCEQEDRCQGARASFEISN